MYKLTDLIQITNKDDLPRKHYLPILTKLEFKPQLDITTWELALIIQAYMKGIQVPLSVERHFKEIE